MAISEEIIKEVKESNPGVQLFKGIIEFDDAEGKHQELEFIYRRPSVADMEAFNKAASKSPFAAQSNLLAGLIAYPEPAAIIATLQDYPPVVADFVNEQVTPFFGTAITSRSSRI